MRSLARSTPNIALIKYWGNRNEELRLPMADSLSMTLDHPNVEISIEESDRFEVHSYDPEGQEKTLTEKQVSRWEKTLDLCRQYLKTLNAPDALPTKITLQIHSHIPPSVGLASSAAVFSCLGKAIAGFVAPSIALTDEQVSILARLGSGSAARSIFGGFSALLAGEGMDIGSSAAIQIAPENHWLLHDIIVIPSHDEKKVGSTEGHALASTSPFYKQRVEDIRNRRQQECIDAIRDRDFEKLQNVTEEDALDMHHVMETSMPPLNYLTANTHRIVAAIKDLRVKEHLPVLFTMDAGPTVHLICTEEAESKVLAFAKAQKGCTIFSANVGPGASLLI